MQHSENVYGYFMERTAPNVYTFYDFGQKKKVKTYCTFKVFPQFVIYVLEVQYVNQLQDYVVIQVTNNEQRLQESPYIREALEVYNRNSPNNHPYDVAGIANHACQLLGLKNPPSRYILGLLRNEKWETLIYDRPDCCVAANVLASFLRPDHPLVDEARVWKALTDVMKTQRAVWLSEQSIHHILRLARAHETIERMIQTKRIIRKETDSKTFHIALAWAAGQDEAFQPPSGSTFVFAESQGNNAHTREVKGTITRMAGGVFKGSRLACVDKFVDERKVVVTMCNTRPWTTQEEEERFLRLNPLPVDGGCRKTLLDTPKVRLGLYCGSDGIGTGGDLVDFLHTLQPDYALFVFTYDDPYGMRHWERTFSGQKTVMKGRDLYVLSPDETEMTNVQTGVVKKQLRLPDWNSFRAFQTCRETDLLHLQPNLFPVILLFVRENTDYRWIDEANRVAGKKLLIVVQIVETNPGPPLPARHRGEFPTMDDVFRQIPPATSVAEVEDKNPRDRKKQKRHAARRPHELSVPAGAAAPNSSSMESLQGYFEAKILPHTWTREPRYELNKNHTVFYAFCGSRCGSLDKHLSIYQMDVYTGEVIRFTDLSGKIKHGPACLLR